MIGPDVQSKYRKKNSEPKPSFISFPKFKQRTGQKFIVEENNSSDGKVVKQFKKASVINKSFKPFSYRDEHSSPFGWKTRSQQNLNFDIYSSKVNRFSTIVLSVYRKIFQEEIDEEGISDASMDVVTARR